MTSPIEGRGEDDPGIESEYSGWKPERAPDYVEMAKEARTRRDGSVRLRNDLGRWVAHFSSSLLVVLAFVDASGSSETIASALAYLVASITIHAVFGSTYVEVQRATLVVYGPLQEVRVPLSSVAAVKLGFFGFPKLVTTSGSFRLWGLSLSNYELLSGGSDDVIVLRREVERGRPAALAVGGDVHNVRETRLRRPDVFGVLLALSWLLYIVRIWP